MWHEIADTAEELVSPYTPKGTAALGQIQASQNINAHAGTAPGQQLQLFEKLSKLDVCIQEILKEYHQATARHGPFHGSHEGYAVLLEEVDELWDEVKANNKQRQREEAIQVAAMALRFLTDI